MLISYPDLNCRLPNHEDEKKTTTSDATGTAKCNALDTLVGQLITWSLENALLKKIKEMERLLFGMTAEDVRKIAFEFAKKMGLKTRFAKDSQMAGKDWLYGFLKRHPDLTIRSPEATSMARAVGFNGPQVTRFFLNLQGSPGTPGKIVASKG